MMKQHQKLILCLVALTAFFLSAKNAWSQSSALNIKKAIEIALENNRALKSDSLNIGVQESKNKETAGLYKPQANFTGSTEYYPAIPSQMLPGKVVGQSDKDYVPVQFGTSYNMKAGVEITKTLYRKDLLLQIRSAGLQTNIAKTKYNLSKEELLYQVAQTFYALQNNAEMIRTTRHDYLNLTEVLRIAKAQFESGVLKRIDYESLEINVANKASYLNQLQTQYNDRLAFFNYLLGFPAAAKTVIDDHISENIHALDENLSSLQREDIRLSNQMIASKEDEIKRIRAEKLPVLNSYFRYSFQSQFNETGKVFNYNYWYDVSNIGITVSIPIMDGKRRKNRLNTAHIQLEQLRLQSEHKQEQAQMELVSATGTLTNNQQQYLITKKNLVLAEKVFSSRKALYTEGVTTLVELLDAESELSQARNNYMQAMIDVQTGWLNVHKAKGTLFTDFLQSI